MGHGKDGGIGFRLGAKGQGTLCLLRTIILLLLMTGCAGSPPVAQRPELVPTEKPLARMGYSVQIGAFSNLDNALGLTELLERHGFSAYYFRHETGLYKVRFGDYPSPETAREEAEPLVFGGIIDAYYIVSPDDYAVGKSRVYNDLALRNDIVSTAESFIGLPYRWGSASPEKGFDCSGLAMSVYQLNGLNLPRSSREQYRAGSPVERSEMIKGDLVFFSTSGEKRVSHVGVYIGDGRFIHAPGKGKAIRRDSLSTPYFADRYVGSRSYF